MSKLNKYMVQLNTEEAELELANVDVDATDLVDHIEMQEAEAALQEAFADIEEANERLDEVEEIQEELEDKIEEAEATIAEVEGTVEEVKEATEETPAEGETTEPAVEGEETKEEEEEKAESVAVDGEIPETAVVAAQESFKYCYAALFGRDQALPTQYVMSTEDIKSDTLTAYKMNLEGLKDTAATAAKWAKQIWDKIVKFISDLFEKIKNLLPSKKKTLTKYLKSLGEANPAADVMAKASEAFIAKYGEKFGGIGMLFPKAEAIGKITQHNGEMTKIVAQYIKSIKPDTDVAMILNTVQHYPLIDDAKKLALSQGLNVTAIVGVTAKGNNVKFTAQITKESDKGPKVTYENVEMKANGLKGFKLDKEQVIGYIKGYLANMDINANNISILNAALKASKENLIKVEGQLKGRVTAAVIKNMSNIFIKEASKFEGPLYSFIQTQVGAILNVDKLVAGNQDKK